ncbi:DUF6221 family protein [Georgenia muralis]|uniref:Uncharacterized protein n=1 Tax=Georgenia muralis TaxID=154117 RepID=A0A3N4YYM6_9MICO|nr:DUF6221 family protein [Georgenia muralis]RPF26279.1 hypothetical protein EDD32_0713 [Georgenia muralis]
MDIARFLLERFAEDEAALRTMSQDAAHAPPATIRIRADRARAEAAAKREILALHECANDVWGFTGCLTCGNGADSTDGYPCPTIRALAAVYAKHPDDEAGSRRQT